MAVFPAESLQRASAHFVICKKVQELMSTIAGLRQSIVGQSTFGQAVGRVQPRNLVTLLALLCPPLVVGLLVYNQISPLFALVGLALLSAVVLILTKPEATTVIVLFVMYANLPVVAKSTFGVPDLLAAAFFLLLGIPLLHYLLIRRQPIIVNHVVVLMVAYLGVSLVSAVFSADVHESVDRLLTYVIEGLVLYVLIINTIRTPALLRQAIWAIILAGVLMGSISIYQEVTGAYDNDFGGMAIVEDAVMGTGQVDSFGNDIKRQRLSGPIGEKNRYAQVMVVLLPLTLFFVWSKQQWPIRVVAALACIPIASGVLLSFSRGAGVAVAILLIVMVLIRAIKLWHLAILALIGYFVIVSVAPDYFYRLSTTSDVAALASGNTAEAGGAVRGRATSNLASLHIFFDYPLLGVGPGQTNLYTGEYGNDIGYRKLEGNRRAHNMYLEELSDTGFFGFVLFMGIIAWPMYQLIQLRRYWSTRRPENNYIIAGLFCAIIAYLATAIFLHLSYIRYYWLLMALAGAAIQIFSPTNSESETASAQMATPLPQLPL